MIKRSRDSSGLKEYVSQIPFEDTDHVSKKYFRISNFPDRLYVGKNSFRISGNNETLVLKSKIHIEVVDSNGDNVYHEVLNVINKDNSKIVVIYIYEDTPVGDVTIYIAGRVKKHPKNGIPISYSDDPSSENYKHIPNIVWIGQSNIVSDEENLSSVFYGTEPHVSFSERFVSYNAISGSQSRLTTFTGSSADKVSLSSKTQPSQYSKKSKFQDAIVEGGRRVRKIPDISNNVGDYLGSAQVPVHFSLSRIRSNNGIFTKTMEGGKIVVSDISVSESLPRNVVGGISIPDYSASIVRVVNNKTIEVDQPFNVDRKYTTTDGQTRDIIFNSFVNQSGFTISYLDEEVDREETRTTESFVDLEFRDIEPLAGTLDRIKMGYKPLGSLGEFVDIGEFKVNEQNFLRDTNAFELSSEFGLIEKRIGRIKDNSDITTYWESSGVNTTGISMTHSDDEISQAFKVSHNEISSSTDYIVIEPKNVSTAKVQASPNTEYKLKLSSHWNSGNDTWSKPFVDVYISGSAVKTDRLKHIGYGNPIKNLELGTYIGSIRSQDGKVQDNEFYFIAENRKEIKPKFVIRSGEWSLGEIELLPRKEKGYSPNQVKLTVPLNDLKSRTELVMDFQYFNVDGKPANLNSRVGGIYFEGHSDIVSKSIVEIKDDVDEVSGSLDHLSGSFTAFSSSVESRIIILEVSGSTSSSSISASYSETSSYALFAETASYTLFAENSDTASYVHWDNVDGAPSIFGSVVDKQLVYGNSANEFTQSSTLVWDYATNTLNVSGGIEVSGDGNGNSFDVKDGNESVFKVNEDGIPVVKQFLTTPNAVAGGIMYSGSAFYIGL